MFRFLSAKVGFLWLTFFFVCFYNFLCFADSPKTNEFSFSLTENKDQILIRTELKDTTLNLLFDTGAHCCLFLENIKDTSRYQVVRRTFIIDSFGKKKKAWLVLLTKIKIGDLQLKEQYFLLMESNEIFKRLGIQGIIGYNVINMYDWKFDLVTKKGEISKKIRPNSEGRFLKINTFIYQDRLHTTTRLDTNYNLRDTCLIDFGDNSGINIKSLYSYKESYEYFGVHSIATGANISVNDTSFIIVVPKVNFDGDLCLSRIPLFTSSILLKSSIGCRFFTMFDEIIILNSSGYILVKKQDFYDFPLRKYNDFLQNNLLSSFYKKKFEDLDIKIGDDIIKKGIDMSEMIHFNVLNCP